MVHSTALARFLRFHENRAIAKRILNAKGLTRITIGVEGLSTFVTRINTNERGEKVEAVYNYEQRPFIRLSWEREEAKSCHVDFSLVLSRPVNG